MSHSALSPTSLEFMSILEKQLAAQENQADNNSNNQSPFSSGYYPFLSPGSNFNNGNGNGNTNFDNNNYNQNQSANVNPQDIPLTPEILNAFLQGLNSAGFSKQEILDFSANQIGQLQDPQIQLQQQQRGFVNPALTGGKGSFGTYNAFANGSTGFLPSPTHSNGSSSGNGSNNKANTDNNNNNNLMAMMMMMNQSIPASTIQTNNPPNGSYPQPGVHTPEASASGKDSAPGSNTSSPEAGLGNSPGSGGSQGGSSSMRQPSSSSAGGEGNPISSRSRRASGDKNDHKRKAEEEELGGHQNLRRHMGEEGEPLRLDCFDQLRTNSSSDISVPRLIGRGSFRQSTSWQFETRGEEGDGVFSPKIHGQWPGQRRPYGCTGQGAQEKESEQGGTKGFPREKGTEGQGR